LQYSRRHRKIADTPVKSHIAIRVAGPKFSSSLNLEKGTLGGQPVTVLHFEADILLDIHWLQVLVARQLGSVAVWCAVMFGGREKDRRKGMVIQ
jgi:hypothetical protein